jgi:hypothetical protein
MQPSIGVDPVRFEFDAPERVVNWRPLVHWLLAIPHLLIAYVLNVVLEVLWLVSFFTVLFTEQIPEGIFNFQVMVLRYQHRVYSYVWFMRESYPAFEFTMTTEDPGGDPLRLAIDRPEKVNRWLPLVKWLLAIPTTSCCCLRVRVSSCSSSRSSPPSREVPAPYARTARQGGA